MLPSCISISIYTYLTAVHDRFLEDRLIHKSSRGRTHALEAEVIIADQLAAAVDAAGALALRREPSTTEGGEAKA